MVQNVCFLLSGEFSFPLFIYFTFYPLVHFLSMDVCVRGCQRACAPVRIGECQVQMSVFGVTLYYSFKLSFITFLYLFVCDGYIRAQLLGVSFLLLPCES